MPVNLLNVEIQDQIKKLFDDQLVNQVELLYFTSGESCATCEETVNLLEEVCAISELLHLSVISADDHAELAEKFHIDLKPCLVISGKTDGHYLEYGLQYAGIPSGYEFTSFIQGILMVSKRDSGLQSQIRSEIKMLTHPVNLKVFVTPT